jgi:hypothetical protein
LSNVTSHSAPLAVSATNRLPWALKARSISDGILRVIGSFRGLRRLYG